MEFQSGSSNPAVKFKPTPARKYAQLLSSRTPLASENGVQHHVVSLWSVRLTPDTFHCLIGQQAEGVVLADLPCRLKLLGAPIKLARHLFYLWQGLGSVPR